MNLREALEGMNSSCPETQILATSPFTPESFAYVSINRGFAKREVAKRPDLSIVGSLAEITQTLVTTKREVAVNGCGSDPIDLTITYLEIMREDRFSTATAYSDTGTYEIAVQRGTDTETRLPLHGKTAAFLMAELRDCFDRSIAEDGYALTVTEYALKEWIRGVTEPDTTQNFEYRCAEPVDEAAARTPINFRIAYQPA